MATKRKMYKKKMSNSKSRKGGVMNMGFPPRSASVAPVNDFGVSYSNLNKDSYNSNLYTNGYNNSNNSSQMNVTQQQQQNTTCDPNNLVNIKDAVSLKNNYDKCCPAKKSWFGTKKNDSPYCKQVDLNYQAQRKNIQLETNDLNQSVNYQGYVPPKKSWHGLWGGKGILGGKRRTKRRTRASKKRSYRNRK